MHYLHSNVSCCLPNWTLCEVKGHCLDNYVKVVFIALGIVEIVSCIQGNCLLLRSLLSRDSMKGSNALYKVYLLNLLCADLGMVGYSLPLLVISLISDPFAVASKVYHKVNVFMFFFCSLGSMLIQLTVCFIRYLRVCHVHFHKKLFSRRLTALFCILCWALALLGALTPVLVDAGCYRDHACSPEDRNHQHYTRVFLAISCLLPVILTGYWNWAIYRHWRDARLKTRSQYAIIQMEIKRLKQRLKSKRRRQTSGEESVENGETGRSCSPGTSENLTLNSAGVDCRVSTQTEPCDGQTGTIQRDFNSCGAGRDTMEESFLQDICYMDQTEDCMDYEDTEDNIDVTDDPDTTLPSEMMSEEPSCDPGGCTPSTITPYPSFSGTQSPRGSRSARRQKGSIKGKSIGRVRAKKYLRQLHRVGKSKKRKEKAFVRSLVIGVLIKAATLLPLGICAAVSAAFLLPAEVWIAAYLLFFGNFSVNWVVFGVMNPWLRSDYVRCFNCVFGRCRDSLVRNDSKTSTG